MYRSYDARMKLIYVGCKVTPVPPQLYSLKYSTWLLKLIQFEVGVNAVVILICVYVDERWQGHHHVSISILNILKISTASVCLAF